MNEVSSLQHQCFTVTHISLTTTLLEIGSLRLLTDPIFDPAGGHYYFGWGTDSKKTDRTFVPWTRSG